MQSKGMTANCLRLYVELITEKLNRPGDSQRHLQTLWCYLNVINSIEVDFHLLSPLGVLS